MPIAQRVVYTECVVVVLKCPVRQSRDRVVIQEFGGSDSPRIREEFEKRLGYRVKQLGGYVVASCPAYLCVVHLELDRTPIRVELECILDEVSGPGRIDAPRIRV